MKLYDPFTTAVEFARQDRRLERRLAALWWACLFGAVALWAAAVWVSRLD